MLRSAFVRGLSFASAVASYIRERVWHESQELADGPGGSVVLRMQVTPGFELQSWIKGFLPHVRVAKPDSLRSELLAELDKARQAFKN